MDDSRNYPLNRFAVVLFEGMAGLLCGAGSSWNDAVSLANFARWSANSILLSRRMLDGCDVGLSVGNPGNVHHVHTWFSRIVGIQHRFGYQPIRFLASHCRGTGAAKARIAVDMIGYKIETVEETRLAERVSSSTASADGLGIDKLSHLSHLSPIKAGDAYNTAPRPARPRDDSQTQPAH